MPTTKARRGLIYGRQSRTRGDSESLDTQVKACKRTAKQHGVTVVDTVLEPPSTSAYRNRGRDRARFKELLDRIEAGDADVVIAYKTDRLSRGGGPGWAPLIESAEKAGIDLDRFVLIAGSGFMSEFECGIRATMDREESKKTAERLRDVKTNAVQAGKPGGGGNRAHGYERDGVTVVEAEAALIREACARYLAGEGLISIARSWNNAGVVTAMGKKWRSETLRNMLRSPRIAGLRQHGRERRGGSLWPAVAGAASWPAIVDRATWEAVCAKLRANQGAPKPSPWKHAFAGLVVCSKCEGRMTAAPVNDRPAFKCLKRPGAVNCGGMAIAATPLEDFVTDLLLYRLDSPGLAKAIAGRTRAASKTNAQAINDVASCEAKLEELAQMWASEEVTRAEWLVARSPVEARLEAARSRAFVQERDRALDGIAGLDEKLLRAQWAELPVSRRRAIAAAVIERVVVSPAPRRGSHAVAPEERTRIDWRV